MNYLGLCKIKQKNTNGAFVGYVNPRCYSHWQAVSPLILMLEGIHQFCVKAVKACFANYQSIQLVPVQLKNLQLKRDYPGQAFQVTGFVESVGSLLKVDFVAKRKEIIATGSVMVSVLAGEDA